MSVVRYTIVTTILFLTVSQMPAQPLTVRVFIADAKALLNAQKEIATGNKAMQATLKRLRRDADKVLDFAPVSVTEKSQTAGSGDKHDYLSLGRYWWPDPNKPDGLPYIQRDGETNPEAESIPDHDNLGKLVKSVETLGLAYFFTGNEEYAEQAAKMLRVWFFDLETRMNPNLNFAQSAKGKPDGRASGMLDGRGFANLIDGVGLLAGSKAWTIDDQKKLVTWFTEYFNWMQTAKMALQEVESGNNHGVWMDVQRTAIAIFIGKLDIASKILNEAKTARIAQQIEPDGTMPRELARTRSMHYTAFNLEAFFNLALLGEQVGVDLWNYQTNDGRGIRKALDWFYPYYAGDKEWTLKQIDPFKKESFYPVFHLASIKYSDKKYAEAAVRFVGEKAKTDRIHLTFGD